MEFDFQAGYKLENANVSLEPLSEGHLPYLLEYSLNEPELWKYSLVGAEGKENLEAYVRKALEARKNKEGYPFIVFDKKSGKYSGSTRFYDFNLAHKSLSIGHTWYGKDYQGTGLNKSCKYLLFEFAFEKIEVERVEFRADARNERSIAAMKSIGCTVEGLLRSNFVTSNGTRRDSIVLSILKSEWENSVKQALNSRI